MASEEAKFVARAERLAGFGGVSSAQRITNRYVLPQFGEQTPYGLKTHDPYSFLKIALFLSAFTIQTDRKSVV